MSAPVEVVPINSIPPDLSADPVPWTGRLMTWLHSPLGGYGYVFRVPVKVLRAASDGSPWVTVEVERGDGTKVKRRVSRLNLVARDNNDRMHHGAPPP